MGSEEDELRTDEGLWNAKRDEKRQRNEVYGLKKAIAEQKTKKAGLPELRDLGTSPDWLAMMDLTASQKKDKREAFDAERAENQAFNRVILEKRRDFETRIHDMGRLLVDMERRHADAVDNVRENRHRLANEERDRRAENRRKSKDRDAAMKRLKSRGKVKRKRKRKRRKR